jgi:hypothetical protein
MAEYLSGPERRKRLRNAGIGAIAGVGVLGAVGYAINESNRAANLEKELNGFRAAGTATAEYIAPSETLTPSPSPTATLNAEQQLSTQVADLESTVASFSAQTPSMESTGTPTLAATNEATRPVPTETATPVAVETPSYIAPEHREQPFFTINNIHPFAQPREWLAQINNTLQLAEQEGVSPDAVIELAHNDWYAYITVRELAQIVNTAQEAKTRYGMVNRNQNDLERLYSFISSEVWTKLTENQLQQDVFESISGPQNYGPEGFSINLNESQASLFENQEDGSVVTLVRAEGAQYTSDRLLQIGLGLFDQISDQLSFASDEARDQYRRNFALAFQREARSFFGFTNPNNSFEIISHMVDGTRVPFTEVPGSTASAAVRYLEDYFSCTYEGSDDPNGNERSGQFEREFELEKIAVQIRNFDGSQQTLTFTHHPFNRNYVIQAGMDKEGILNALRAEGSELITPPSAQALVEQIMNFHGQDGGDNPEGFGYVEIINVDSGAGLESENGVPFRDVPVRYVLGEIERQNPQLAAAIQQQLLYYRQCRAQGLVPTAAPIFMTTPEGFVFTITPEYTPGTPVTPDVTPTIPFERTSTPSKSPDEDGNGNAGQETDPTVREEPLDVIVPTSQPLPTSPPPAATPFNF